MEPVKIIIADDHHLFADGVAQILASVEHYRVVGKAENGRMLMQLLNSVQPHLVLLDINMPHMDGMESAIEIRRKVPDVKVIFVSVYSSPKMVAFAKRNHIEGFLLKNSTTEELKAAIEEVLKGNIVYATGHVDKQEDRRPDDQDEFQQKLKLSPREIEIIQLIKEGKSSKIIADQLNLSLFTVETHRKNIFRKLDIRNMAELSSIASRLKL